MEQRSNKEVGNDKEGQRAQGLKTFIYSKPYPLFVNVYSNMSRKIHSLYLLD